MLSKLSNIHPWAKKFQKNVWNFPGKNFGNFKKKFAILGNLVRNFGKNGKFFRVAKGKRKFPVLLELEHVPCSKLVKIKKRRHNRPLSCIYATVSCHAKFGAELAFLRSHTGWYVQ